MLLDGKMVCEDADAKGKLKIYHENAELRIGEICNEIG